MTKTTRSSRPPTPATTSRGRWPLRLAAFTVVVAAAATLAWWWSARADAPAFRRSPEQNVLLITIDTLRADALSLYGGRAASPALTALAGQGVVFDFAHSHAVVTLPSHASILTGLNPYQHGIRDNSGYRLRPDTATLATRLKASGFATAAFVSAFPLDSRFGLGLGFDVYDDRFGQSSGPTEFSLAERSAGAVVTPALDWINAQHGKWLAWVHVFDPHAPYRPPAPFDTPYADSPYHGEVAYVDAALRPLLERAAADPSRQTLVVITSDHGEGLGDHGELTHGLFAYESTLHVPLIVAQVPQAAGRRTIATRSAAPVSHVDLVPTVLDLLGLDVPAVLPGRSLMGVLQGDTSRREGAASYFEAMSASINRGWAPLQGALVDREKIVDVPILEVYDLASDPGERDNLADRDRARRDRLQAQLDEFGSTGPAQKAAEDPEVAARLRALGYVAANPTRKPRYTDDDDPKRLVEVDRQVFQGVVLAEAHRYSEAADIYRSIIARRPDMTLAYRHLGYVLWQRGQPHEAIGVLREAVDRGAGNDEILAQLGIYLAETGSPADAVGLLEPAAERSSDIEVLNALGVAYARSGARRQALAVYERIFAIDPTDAMAHQNSGSIHLEGNDLVAARDAFVAALTADPKLASAHTGLGVVEQRSGNRRAAIEQWRAAMALDPDDFNALYNLATELADAGQLAEAQPFIERFVATAPPAFYADDIRRLRARLAAR